MPQVAVSEPISAPTAAHSEFERFLTLFDRLVTETSLWMEKTPQDKLDWVPVDTPQMRFGDRISRITIASLFAHVIVASYKWVRHIKDCPEGDTIPLPKDPEMMAQCMTGDAVATARRMHAETMEVLRGYGEAELGKTVRFAGDGSQWSGMGFLWSMWAHHAFHLGNLDTYLRQADVEAPDFFSFDPKVMA